MNNSPNLSDEINSNIAQSEIEGGAYLNNLGLGEVLHVRTKNTSYTIERREDGFYISGHPKYCPEPVLSYISGSTWGGSLLKAGFIGRGMHLEFRIPSYVGRGAIVTSAIQDITEVK
jgi:hypothetical protein